MKWRGCPLSTMSADACDTSVSRWTIASEPSRMVTPLGVMHGPVAVEQIAQLET